MNKICTSLEQSKKLIELGIDTDTADMCYKCLGEDPYDLIVRPYSDWKEEYKILLRSGDAKVYPAWSLSALLELIPPYLEEFNDGIDFGFSKSMNGKWYSAHYIQLDNSGLATFTKTVTGDTSVDAAFEMVYWLLENKKL